jgi:SAM-dependent methyltransferase
MPDIPLCRALRAVYVPHPTHLPFEAGVFDAVLCCGVLEHVEESNPRGNAVESLRELARVLRPHGRLLIYQLPQRCAWQEAVVRRLRLGYAHPRRYSEDEITGMLRETGYRVQGVRRANLFPRNLTCLPEWLRATYSLFSHAVIALDGVLCGVPGLNRLAGVVEVCAQRDAEHAARPEGPAQAAR